MEIDKNIPIPGSWQHSTGLAPFLRRLEVGDSFLSDGRYKRATVMSTARYLGIKLISRTTAEGVRFWRTK